MPNPKLKEEVANLNQAGSPVIGERAALRNFGTVDRTSGTRILIGAYESVDSENIKNKCIMDGIFEAQELVLRHVETGEVTRLISMPPNRCYDCLYCLQVGIIHGTRKLKRAKNHRAECMNNPNQNLHKAQYVHQYKQRTKKSKNSRNIEPLTKEERKKTRIDNTKYWVQLGPNIWACRKCRRYGEPRKTWSTQGWVRNHWQKCKYNDRKGAIVPKPLPPSRKKSLKKDSPTLQDKRSLKVLRKGSC